MSSIINMNGHILLKFWRSNVWIFRHNLTETFVDNLSLGLAKSLEKLPGVQVSNIYHINLCNTSDLRSTNIYNASQFGIRVWIEYVLVKCDNIRMCEWQRCPLATCWHWQRGTNAIPQHSLTASETSILQGVISVVSIMTLLNSSVLPVIKNYLITLRHHYHRQVHFFNLTISDGFRLTWSYSHLGPAMPVGSINLNRLNKMMWTFL